MLDVIDNLWEHLYTLIPIELFIYSIVNLDQSARFRSSYVHWQRRELVVSVAAVMIFFLRSKQRRNAVY